MRCWLLGDAGLGNAALVVLLLGVPLPLVDLDSDDDERFRLSAMPAVLGTLLLSPDVDLTTSTQWSAWSSFKQKDDNRSRPGAYLAACRTCSSK